MKNPYAIAGIGISLGSLTISKIETDADSGVPEDRHGLDGVAGVPEASRGFCMAGWR
jgi:hypothetical protein